MNNYNIFLDKERFLGKNKETNKRTKNTNRKYNILDEGYMQKFHNIKNLRSMRRITFDWNTLPSQKSPTLPGRQAQLKLSSVGLHVPPNIQGLG